MRFLLIVTICGWVQARSIINCPKNCICDKPMNWKRVKCTNQNLMNIGDDIPVGVEILDISNNQISVLFEDEFTNLGLKSIKSLNISHNKIGHMHMNAFKNLNKIRTIDLSFNIIEYILHEWFNNLPNFKELYMNNNNFFKLRTNESLLESKSLRILDISYCKLTQLSEVAFSKLPALEVLKMDGNFLIEVNPALLKPSTYLHVLTLNENPFNCGKTMNDLKKYAKSAGISYVDPCSQQKPPNVEKSQKMMAIEGTVQENNLWMYEEEDDYTEASKIYNCTERPFQERELLMQIIELSPIISVIVMLTTGCLLGLIIGCSVPIGSRKPDKLKRRRRHSIIRRTFIENEQLVLNCESPFESTPMMHRRVETYPLR